MRLAVEHSGFWRRHANGVAPERWRELATVDKATMMASFDEYNTRNVRAADASALAVRAEQTRDFAPKLDGLTVGMSSGTSGHRTISLLDDSELYGFVGFMLE